jgi:hypothetical protein
MTNRANGLVGLLETLAVGFVLILILLVGSKDQTAAAIPPSPGQPATAPPTSNLASAPASSTHFTVTTDDGRAIQVNQAGDCNSLGDAWLVDWCANLAGFKPSIIPQQTADIPQNLHGAAWTDFDRHVQSALAWAILNNDPSMCDSPVVATYFAVGSHVADGAATCRADLQAVVQKGWFFVTSPTSQLNARIALASVSH